MGDRFVQPLEPRRLLAATYYVSPAGNDALDGRSPQTAWRTIGRVNGKNWNPGDRVLFEGGKTFSAAGGSTTNLLSNAGFESGLTGWSDTIGTAAARATVTKTSGTVRSGTSAIKISGAGDGIRAQDVTKKLRPNQLYRMSAWTKTASPGSGDRRVGVTFYLGGAKVGTYYRGFRGESWAQTQWQFAAPAFDKALVWVARTGDNSTFYVDDVTLTPAANGIVLNAADSGTAQYPVTIGSYGAGRATINAGDSIGLWAENVAGLWISNLNFTGSWNAATGSGNNAGVGVELVNTLANNTKLDFIRIERVEARGFRWAGIRVGGWNGKSGFRDVVIADAVARGNGDMGIHIRGDFSRTATAYANENVRIVRSHAYENSGIPNKGGNSGSGIQVSDTFSAIIERNVAHHNGALNNYAGGGPVGIWAFDSSRVTIHYNESYANRTNSSKDGGGFDLDGGVTQSLVQYNYSHDNDGPGFLLCQFSGARPWGSNIVRYNVSQNDARKNSYGAITFSGGGTGEAAVANVAVEHNTVYLAPAASGTPAGLKFNGSGGGSGGVGGGVHVRNNIIQTTAGLPLVYAAAAPALVGLNGNAYWSGAGGAFRVRWGGTTHTSFTGWRNASGKESAGLNVDPGLTAAGKGPTFNNAYKLATLTAYTLRSDSPLKGRGIALRSPFAGYVPAQYDFFSRATGTAREIGAAEIL